MQALPNNKWRNFVEFFLLEQPGYGAQVNAARRAGFGNAKTTPLNMARIASRLMRAEHKDRARGIAMVLARTDPEVQHHDLQVTHKIEDPDHEALEELRALRQLGTSRESFSNCSAATAWRVSNGLKLPSSNAAPRTQR